MSSPRLDASYDRDLDWGHWRKLLRYTLRRPWEVVFFCLAGSLVGLADLGFPLVTRRAVDDVAMSGEANLSAYGAMYGALTVLLAVGVKLFIALGGRIRTRVAHDIRADAFGNLQELSFSFFDHRPVGWLMARMTSDCERLSNIMAWGLLDLVWGATIMGGVGIVLFALNAKLAAVTLSVVPVLAWVSAFFQKRILASSRTVRKTNSRLTAACNESIGGVRTTKVFAREDQDLAEFRALSGEMYTASVRNQLQSALYLPIVMTLGSLATGLALAVGGVEVLAGTITVGTLIVTRSPSRRTAARSSGWSAFVSRASTSTGSSCASSSKATS